MAKSFDDWVESTFTLLGTFGNGSRSSCKPYSIPMVPEELRKGNEKAHEPKVVSIGPRFKGRRELLPMEEIKMSCMRFLLQRRDFYSHSKGASIRSILENCMSLVSTYEAAVRTSYAEDIELDSFDLASIVLQDACFLLELLISRSPRWETILEVDMNSPATELGNMELILSDITLLENQIPFFLLYTLFEQLFSDVIPFDRLRDNSYPGIMEELVLSLFGYSSDSSSKSVPHNSSNSTPYRPINASHILELLHSFFILSEKNQHSQQRSSVVDIIDVDIGIDVNRQTKLNRCATRLLAAGVTILESEDKCFIPKFSSGMLQIPPLCISQTTEATWRTFIAWDIHTNKWKKSDRGDLFTIRALLFNDLICCASDIQLLKDRGIIVDELGMSDRDLIYLFRSFTNGIDRGLVQSTFCNMIHSLNTYSATNRVIRAHRILWHYLSRFPEWLYGLTKFLKSGYNFAAALITLLTVVQTCYAILSYHYPKN